MNETTIYDAATGLVRRTYVGPNPEAQLQPGEALVPGLLPLAGCRIDLATGQPVHFAPPSPPGMQWDAASGMHVPTEQERARRETMRQIAQLETRQARALREAALGQPGAAARLQAIDDEIATLRGQL